MENEKANILSVQQDLRVLHTVHPEIPLVNPDGIYDQVTEDAVKVFQRLYALPVTGEVDHETFSRLVGQTDAVREARSDPKLLKVFDREELPLSPGHYSGEVYLLQALINALALRYEDLSKVDVTGEYDQKTAKQIRNLQNLLGLPPTGVMDKALWDRLSVIWK